MTKAYTPPYPLSFRERLMRLGLRILRKPPVDIDLTGAPAIDGAKPAGPGPLTRALSNALPLVTTAMVVIACGFLFAIGQTLWAAACEHVFPNLFNPY